MLIGKTPKLRVEWYPYEDSYRIVVWYSLNGSMSNFCSFKGTIKAENNKRMLIDFYQSPPIHPALVVQMIDNYYV